MNFRLTAILLGVILAFGVVLLVLTFTGDDGKPPTELLLEELAAVKPDQIDTVELEHADGKRLKLVRVGPGRWDAEWDVAAPGGGRQPVKAPAEPSAVTQVISSLLRAKPVAHAGLSPNPASHGLQPPGLKVTLRQGSERSGTVNLGDVTIGGDGGIVFVTTSRRPDRPMAASRTYFDPLFSGSTAVGKAVDMAKWAGDFRVKNVFGDAASADMVNAVTLTAKGKTLGLTRSSAGWEFTSPAGWGAADPHGDAKNLTPGAITGVNPLLNTLTNLQAQSAADFVENPTPQQLKDHGLEPGNPDAIRVELAGKNNEKVVAFIGKKDAAAPPPPTAHGMPPQPSGKVWVRVEGQPGVIRATGADLGGLAAVIDNPDPLRDRTLLAVERSRIDGIDTSAGARLRRTGANEWKLYGPPRPNEPQPTGRDAVNRLLDVLTERRTIKAFPPPNDANFAPNVTQAEVKVWADGFESPANPKDEPKPRADAKPTTLIFGKAEGNQVHVRRVRPDGAKADFLLPEKLTVGLAAEPVALVEAVRKSRLDLLDPGLKTFSPEVATRITVGGTAGYELVKDEARDPSTLGDRWTFAAPADKKGQVADAGTVAEMLRLLGTTSSATRIVNEAPDEAALASHGLAPAKTPPKDAPPAPRLKVAVGLKSDADKERVIEFGTPTADPNFVHARQGGQGPVFTVPRLLYDKFASPDLRDKHLFRFDVARVTGLEVKGWVKDGKETALHVVKGKDGEWVTQSPPTPAGFMLDPGKVTAFLNTLSKTPVKSYVGATRPEHGLDKEYLLITVRIQDHPGIALNIGALTEDRQSFYGWTSILPAAAPVYTLPAAPFRAYKEGPNAFAR